VARWLFGTVDIQSGEGLYQIYEEATSAEVIRHFDDLLQMFPGEHLLLVMDNASFHQSDAIRDYIAHAEGRLELVPMPTYSPHLNRIEQIWNYLRSKVTRNIFWGTIARLCEAAIDFLRTLDFATFLSVVGTHAR
jgi:transposase